jgi:hypothetical protein
MGKLSDLLSLGNPKTALTPQPHPGGTITQSGTSMLDFNSTGGPYNTATTNRELAPAKTLLTINFLKSLFSMNPDINVDLQQTSMFDRIELTIIVSSTEAFKKMMLFRRSYVIASGGSYGRGSYGITRPSVDDSIDLMIREMLRDITQIALTQVKEHVRRVHEYPSGINEVTEVPYGL